MEVLALLIAVLPLILSVVALGQANKANRRLNEMEGRYIQMLERRSQRQD